jgi:hypothetical protein
MLILKALSLGPLHGYGLIQRIRLLSDELLEVEQGSLYPAVYRIEQRGWISSKWGVTETGRRAKFYFGGAGKGGGQNRKINRPHGIESQEKSGYKFDEGFVPM